MKRLIVALFAVTLAATTSACGSNVARFEREAKAAGFGEAVSYEAYSAGLPNNETRARVDTSKVDDPDALLRLLEGQRITDVALSRPDGGESNFDRARFSYLSVFFDALPIDAKLEGTHVYVSNSTLVIEGEVSAPALREAAPLGSRLEKVLIVGTPEVSIKDGLAEPDLVAGVVEAARSQSPYPVFSIDWDRGVKHLMVLAGERPDQIDRAEFAWVEPYLSNEDPRVLFSQPRGGGGGPLRMPPNFQLR
ncbi:hypothetical protein CGLAU_01960 [Corynebacterium glaucum]|uniref:Uncharacterized protein n=1 Tax=Corynebacterium glaucum TaxID=187491 RepID=A0A1Q2HU53_9CORY|nr:hypothetical protein [Corynebacterium glaucum]AQQ14377.1 hypothetical protein CGLAU_01960 [Corynebacterium glaucum]